MPSIQHGKFAVPQNTGFMLKETLFEEAIGKQNGLEINHLFYFIHLFIHLFVRDHVQKTLLKQSKGTLYHVTAFQLTSMSSPCGRQEINELD